jgi:hypothetical protein
VRYYDTQIIDGKPTRVQKSHKLVEKDKKYHSRACKPVRQKCEEFMRGINEQAPGQVKQTVIVADFRRNMPRISSVVNRRRSKFGMKRQSSVMEQDSSSSEEYFH